jgi:hypothetical protein
MTTSLYHQIIWLYLIPLGVLGFWGVLNKAKLFDDKDL